MATTSIWSVKGWLGKVVNYVENPEKTETKGIHKNQELQGLEDVIRYAVNERKTRKENAVAGEELPALQQYVSGINCMPGTARSEMIAVKKHYGKEDGIVAFHGYQSFAPGECTPGMAHEIGVKLAERLWGDRYQVLVATHLDKAHHLHNHFVINSVSFRDGKRYHRTKQDYRDMRAASDELCKEYGLSIIPETEGHLTKHYGEWKAEQEGRPTYRNMIKQDVDAAIRQARTEKQFYELLKKQGYTLKFGKDLTVRPPGRDRGLKLARNLGETYTIEAIRTRILSENDLEKTNVEIATFPKRIPGHIYQKKRIKVKQGKCIKVRGLRGLYFHYCYTLGIFPKKQKKSSRQMHWLLREDLNRLEQYSKEIRLLFRHEIDTIEQLNEFRCQCEDRMEQLGKERQHLRYRSRGKLSVEELVALKSNISELTLQMKEIRREIQLCQNIEERSSQIREKLQRIQTEQKEQQKEDDTKEVKEYGNIRRSR